MRTLRWLAKAANRTAYLSYVNLVRLWETPSVLAERQPKFTRDETVRSASGDVYALAVKYTVFGFDDGYLELLDALRRQNINAIAVINGQPTERQLGLIRQRAHRILVRPNIGRDFGAYRAATLKLVGEGLQISRLLYFNDSVVYLPGLPLDRMIAGLRSSDYDVVGTLENHERQHHVGSFSFSVSQAVLSDQHVQRFWAKYKPYSLRPHAINNGEIRLSSLLQDRGYAMDVIYSSERMAQQLDALSLNELITLLRYLPGLGSPATASAMLQPSAETASALSQSRRHAAEASEGEEAVPGISQFRGGKSRKSAPATWDLRRDDLLTREALVNRMLASFINHSQIHFGFGLYHRVMQCPLIKKDLLARGVFLEHECVRVLDDLPPPMVARVIRQLVNRGRPVQVSGMRRFKFANGLI